MNTTNTVTSPDFNSKLSFELTSTAFLHGSRGEEFTELRPSEVRGLMRFWFRAALLGALPINSVRELEGEVFGRAGDSRERLRILLRLEGGFRKHTRKDRSRVPHKAADLPPSKEGSLIPGAVISLSVQTRNSKDPLVHQAALAALWLSATLGAFGGRMRRGAGSVRISASETLQTYEVGRKEDWERYINAGITSSLSALKEFASARGAQFLSPFQLATLPSFSSPASEVFLSQESFVSEEELRREVMLRMRPFKNEVFGLPLRHPGVKTPPGRFPSPLWMRAVPVIESHEEPKVVRYLVQSTVLPPFPNHPHADRTRIGEFLAALKSDSVAKLSELLV